MKALIFVSLPTPSAQEQHIQEFVEWMGVQTRSIVIDVNSDSVRQLLDETVAGCCLAMTPETLAAMHKASSQHAHLRGFFEEQCTAVFVFGWTDSLPDSALLTWLTDGGIRRVISPGESWDREKEFHLPLSGKVISRQLAGLSFCVTREFRQSAFELDANASAIEAIMLAKSHPTFICLKLELCQVFLLAGSEAPDVQEPLKRNTGIEDHYDQIIPVLAFLRHCFGQSSWHAPEITARLIIDDPLLADKYGLLDYSTLLRSMQRENYGVSIAFIPWNYRRTSRRWAESLLSEKANLSICVHGCDHTNKEFDDLDPAVLDHKARLALARMEKHRERTRLPFERVMVFPQGRFSRGAMLALRANNYLAAVNTSCFPTDYAPDELRMADLLRPAITRFHGFPIFQRHYPQQLIDLAFDIFLGKPALLVEHHQYFGDGCKRLEEFVAGMYRIEPKLTWPTLSSQLARSCMMRRRSEDSFDVHFFTRRFQLKNIQAHRCNFVLEKAEPAPSLIREVLVNGTSVPFRTKENSLQLELEADAGQTKEIEVLDYPGANTPPKRSGITYSTGVLFRRELSEFRDNTLSRHPAMLRATRRIAKRLKMTGDRKIESQD